MPRSKKNTGCVKLVEPITEKEYLTGKQNEKDNLHLQTFKSRKNKVA